MNLAIGLRMDLLSNEFCTCELSKAHPLGDAIDFFKMAMIKVTRDKTVDRVPNVAQREDVDEVASVWQIE